MVTRLSDFFYTSLSLDLCLSPLQQSAVWSYFYCLLWPSFRILAAVLCRWSQDGQTFINSHLQSWRLAPDISSLEFFTPSCGSLFALSSINIVRVCTTSCMGSVWSQQTELCQQNLQDNDVLVVLGYAPYFFVASKKNLHKPRSKFINILFQINCSLNYDLQLLFLQFLHRTHLNFYKFTFGINIALFLKSSLYQTVIVKIVHLQNKTSTY